MVSSDVDCSSDLPDFKRTVFRPLSAHFPLFVHVMAFEFLFSHFPALHQSFVIDIIKPSLWLIDVLLGTKGYEGTTGEDVLGMASYGCSGRVAFWNECFRPIVD